MPKQAVKKAKTKAKTVAAKSVSTARKAEYQARAKKAWRTRRSAAARSR